MSNNITQATERALAFLDAHRAERPVEAVWAEALVAQRPVTEVIAALRGYQNADGGFGQGLEPDITAPASNPFAARLALQVCVSLRVTDDPVFAKLLDWLEREQYDDGCWRFAPEVLAHPIAPWFAGWTFPALNPALCLAGYLGRLGAGSTRLHQRCAELFDEMKNPDDIRSGEFYTVLPYAESLPWLTELADRDNLLALLVERVTNDLDQGAYADTPHAWEHVGPIDGPVAQHIAEETLAALVERTLSEQTDDGGWPSPYAAHWRPWITASSVATLIHWTKRPHA